MSAKGARVGPFARLRPGTDLAQGRAHRKFRRGQGGQDRGRRQSQSSAYIGDARVGEGANVGAGTITCNYDGVAKHRTDIGKGAFIGSNSGAGRAGQGRRWCLCRHRNGRHQGCAGRRALAIARASRRLRKAGQNACGGESLWART